MQTSHEAHARAVRLDHKQDNANKAKELQQGQCERRVVTYADPLRLTLEWMKQMLAADDGIAAEAATDDEFKASFARSNQALAAGALESAESAIERAIELFAGVQNRVFLKRRSPRA